MHILHLLILASFYYSSASPSLAASDTQVFEDEMNSPATDATFDTKLVQDGLALPSSDAALDTQVFEDGLTLPPHDQPLDESTTNSNPIPGSDSTNFLDGNTVADAGETPTEFNTDSSQEIVAENLCPSPGSRPNRKLRARGQNSCSAPRQIDAGGINGESDGEEVPDMSMTKFNARPLGRDETMDDMCKRFMGGILPNAVCSSGSSDDETHSVFSHPLIPFVVIKLQNCFRGMFIDLLFTLSLGKSYLL